MVNQDVHPAQGGGPVAGKAVIQRGVALGARLQLIVEIGQHFRQRHRIFHNHPDLLLPGGIGIGPLAGRHPLNIFHPLEIGTAGVHQFHHRPHMTIGRDNGQVQRRLLNFLDFVGLRQPGGIVHPDNAAIGQSHLIGHAGGSNNQIQIILPLQPFLDDFQVHQPQETAAKAEPQGPAAFRLHSQRGVIQPQLFQGGPQTAVLLAVRGIEAGKDHRFQFHIAGQGNGRRPDAAGQSVADAALLHILEPGRHIAHLPGGQGVHRRGKGREHPHLDNFRRLARGHHHYLVAAGDLPVLHPHMGDNALVGVIDRIKDQGAQGFRGAAAGRRKACHHRLEDGVGSGALLGRHKEDFVIPKAENLFQLPGHPFRLRLRQIHLVDHRNQFQVILHRQQGIGNGLGFDALAGVHHQQRPLAGGQSAGNFIAEVHMARRVNQVQLIGLPVPGLALHGHGLALNGNAPFPFQLHLVHKLGFHFLGADGAGNFQKAVGQGGLAMVNMGNDAKVADQFRIHNANMVTYWPDSNKDWE